MGSLLSPVAKYWTEKQNSQKAVSEPGTVSSVALRVEEADVYSYMKRNMVAPTCPRRSNGGSQGSREGLSPLPHRSRKSRCPPNLACDLSFTCVRLRLHGTLAKRTVGILIILRKERS